MDEYSDLWPKSLGRQNILYNFNSVMCVCIGIYDRLQARCTVWIIYRFKSCC